jgi:hypothetical protein
VQAFRLVADHVVVLARFLERRANNSLGKGRKQKLLLGFLEASSIPGKIWPMLPVPWNSEDIC